MELLYKLKPLRNSVFAKNGMARNYANRGSCRGNRDDCGYECPDRGPKPNKRFEVVHEKSCTLCSFFTWKPKEVVLPGNRPLVEQKRKIEERKQRHCYAGMKTAPKKPTVCELRAKAAECYRIACPSNIDRMLCPKAQPPPKEEPVKMRVCPKPVCPRPDWDFDACK